MSKTEELRYQINIYALNIQRELDSKDALIQLLDRNIDENEDLYQVTVKNQLLHLESLLELQNQRLKGLTEEFQRDIQILEDEFEIERQSMIKTNQQHLSELEDIIETVKDEEKKNRDDQQNEYSQFKEETKNKNLEEINVMKIILESKQTKYYTELEQMNSKFQSDTSNKFQEHQYYHNHNKIKKKEIDRYLRMISFKKARIDLEKIKILQHHQDFMLRNQGLLKEKDNILKNYHDLKHKMIRFREEETRRLKELTNNSRNTVIQLKDYIKLGQRILETAELCRKFETEQEKIIPFYKQTSDISEIPEKYTQEYIHLQKDKSEEYKYLDNFFKRFNKVLLDKIAIQSQKVQLYKNNQTLKYLLKQYLDGISVNDDVIKNQYNPLFIVNNKFSLQYPLKKEGSPTNKQEGCHIIRNITHQLQNQKQSRL
ncbi:hypothetical protein IMG5_118130 [Ichthyophthirius multifiliis]|uniref:Uncharacterized protein n=1 Tax=Ichthyophthirius multifiliis TaxID=5932 RepID=G0QUP2_ICHMU|nr:hypothetical protein IMG5_118130 [Ichthyophthirius multifiliis]EGR31088.1 hypothetical protein IMG5_118130 [Ichthyophthirius multifiliis]|eukprot:XP_004034574.1 hypothetical protein IMG5_118130 [Ichthyophthirius multifiliis]